MSDPITRERLAELRAECVADWGGLSPDAGNEVLDEIERLERERDEARDLLRRAYNEAMDHDIDSRELDEKIKLILRERVLRGEDRPLDVPGPSGEENPPLADKEE